MRDLQGAILTEHARRRLQRRRIPEAAVRELLSTSEDSKLVRPGRVVVQGLKTPEASGKPVLIRIFVDIGRFPPEIVTVYITSKADKYTRPP